MKALAKEDIDLIRPGCFRAMLQYVTRDVNPEDNPQKLDYFIVTRVDNLLIRCAFQNGMYIDIGKTLMLNRLVKKLIIFENGITCFNEAKYVVEHYGLKETLGKMIDKQDIAEYRRDRFIYGGRED